MVRGLGRVAVGGGFCCCASEQDLWRQGGGWDGGGMITGQSRLNTDTDDEASARAIHVIRIPAATLRSLDPPAC